MTEPEVSVHGELAELAAAKAETDGISLEDLIERWLREYVADQRR